MDAVLVFNIVMWGLIIAMLASWVFSKVTQRFFPKYAAKRKLKAEKKSERQRLKRQRKRAKERDRVLEWAKAHPDDPTAKALLALETAPAVSSAVGPMSEPEFDPMVELQRRQREADDMQQRLEARRIAEELRVQQLLEWALEHPDTPEAQRHLEETLVEVCKRVERAESDIRHATTMSSYHPDGLEAIEYATRQSEAEARKQADVEMIARIQKTLSIPLPTTE